MANLLYLVHRIPYPPNKGDKLRSFHLLKYLSQNHNVFLGTFVDDAADLSYLPALQEFCADIKAIQLFPVAARLRALNGLLSGDPLTVRYFRDAKMQRWVSETIQNHNIEAAIVFCSGMAQYVETKTRLPIFLDLVDVDSLKWKAYSKTQRGVMKWLFARESEVLLNYERRIAAKSTRTFFVSEEEKRAFCRLSPENAFHVGVIRNGVDTAYFDARHELPSPYAEDEIPIVFTGTMSYWINDQAAQWFIYQVVPLLVSRHPGIRFYVVGRSPSSELQALESQHVSVTGTVDDVRPYLKHARIIVAPIKTSRGLQNKVLEALAMGKPVVLDKQCDEVFSDFPDSELPRASTPHDYAKIIENFIQSPEIAQLAGENARLRICNDYNWDNQIGIIGPYLPSS